MEKCSCYHEHLIDTLGGYETLGECWGTKEKEACSCEGDRTKCTHYAPTPIESEIQTEAECSWFKYLKSYDIAFCKLNHSMCNCSGDPSQCDLVKKEVAKMNNTKVPVSIIRWNEGTAPDGENLLVRVIDDCGDNPFTYTAVAWMTLNGDWISDNDMLCGRVEKWAHLPQDTVLMEV